MLANPLWQSSDTFTLHTWVLTISCCLAIQRGIQLMAQFGIGLVTHAGKCTLLYAQHVLAVSLVQLCQGLQASHINCKWQSYLLAVKVPGGCDPQKLLAQNANNCSHGPSAVGLLTLCKPAVQRLSWNISS